MLYFSKGNIAYASGVNSQSKEFIQRIERNLGLDKPLLTQYKIWLFKALKGDFGVSLLSGESVVKMIKERLFNTLILSLSALSILFVLSIILAFVEYHFKNSFIEKMIAFITFNFFALPPLVLALLFILVFGIFWNFSSWIDFSDDNFLNQLKHLILPILVLVLSHLAIYLRIVKNFIHESFSQIFIQNLYARALRQREIDCLVLRYSLGSIIAYFGSTALSFIMGAYIVESVFNYSGLGSLLLESIIFKDFPVVLALLFLSVLSAAFFTFLSDMIARALNPKLRKFSFA
ncbi:ABC transporter permease [Campylobacter estrildidarum]|uniref:ABC transporter permease n=2 Tax=Campylobacter estrildidarum TaxID=2510189 RepID=A0A4U7BGJ9_9BACT|nr:ABC transporter permease [Campylobacter estrildidarum]